MSAVSGAHSPEASNAFLTKHLYVSCFTQSHSEAISAVNTSPTSEMSLAAYKRETPSPGLLTFSGSHIVEHEALREQASVDRPHKEQYRIPVPFHQH